MWDPIAIGRRGGLSKSPRKVAAARRNGKLGGAKGGRPPKLPPRPKGVVPPPGSSFEEAKAHAHKFIEYYAELAVRNKMQSWPYFTEREFLDTLRRMGRYDLVYRRKKQGGKPPSPRDQRRLMKLYKTPS